MFIGRAAIAFLASLLFTRALGASGRGQVLFILNTAGMLALLAGAGTGSALLRWGATGAQDVGRAYTASLFAGLIWGGLAAAGFGLAYWQLDRSVFSGVGGGEALGVVGLALALVAGANVGQVAGLAGRLPRLATAGLVGSAVYLVAVAVGAATTGLTVGFVVAAFAFGSLLSLVLTMWPRSSVRLQLGGSGRLTRELLGAGLRTQVASAAVLVLWRLDVVLVKVYRGYAEVGLYTAATSIAEIVLVIIVSLRTALLPSHGHGRDRHQLADRVCRTVGLGLVAGSALGLLVGAAGTAVLGTAYGQGFRSGATALALLLPGVVLLALHFPLFDYLIAEGHGRALNIAALFALALNVAANCALLPVLGYAGAAVGSSVAYAALFVACAGLFCRATGRRFTDLLPSFATTGSTMPSQGAGS